jgi:predicted PhzF superfamily epimerase YddE/YHI9
VLWEEASRADAAGAFSHQERPPHRRSARSLDRARLPGHAGAGAAASGAGRGDRRQAAFVGRSRFDYLVEVESEAVRIAGARSRRDRNGVEARGVIVTSRAENGEYDFVSRFFAPQSGVPEDPVTGSAHCALTPYWSAKLGKKELVAYQASSRGGTLRLRLDGERVKLGGQAVTVLRGELTPAIWRRDRHYQQQTTASSATSSPSAPAPRGARPARCRPASTASCPPPASASGAC